jgi:acetylornithine deacetylase/succinyl-diaminopimelate desuccinylase-like protein
VIPSVARAKISCRLVPNQDPQVVAQQIADYLKLLSPQGLEIRVNWDHGGKAVRTSPDTKIAQICSESFSEVFGKPCRQILCGASIPLVAELTEASGGEVAVIGVSLDSDDIHAPNEHFGFDQLEQGFLTMATILGRLAR